MFIYPPGLESTASDQFLNLRHQNFVCVIHTLLSVCVALLSVSWLLSTPDSLVVRLSQNNAESGDERSELEPSLSVCLGCMLHQLLPADCLRHTSPTLLRPGLSSQTFVLVLDSITNNVHHGVLQMYIIYFVFIFSHPHI